MQTTTFSLGELLRRIKSKNLAIPQFQRTFTWKEAQVKLLIDSISRSYPIGSLLLLAKMPDLPLASRNIEAYLKEEDANKSDSLEFEIDKNLDLFYILDGQQRTTSIARVFLDANDKKNYYFDLKLMHESYQDDNTTWIITRKRGDKNPDRKEKGRLLRADIVLDQKKSDVYIQEYIEDSDDFPEFKESNGKNEARQAASAIKGVFEAIRNYQVPVVILDRETGIESVCRVFETINSTGTRLTTFDLAVARFYPKPDLRTLWDEGLAKHKILKDFEVDGERVLQVLHLIRAAAAGKSLEPTRTELLNLPPDEIAKQWNLALKALANAYEWAAGQGAKPKTLPNHGIIVVLAAYSGFFSEGKQRYLREGEPSTQRWYFCKALQAGASKATNYRIAQDFTNLYRARESRENLRFDEVRLNIEDIIRLKPGDVRYKAIQNLMAVALKQDFATGKKITDISKLHDHHIFPRSGLKKYGLSPDILDSISNRIAVLEETNLSLSDSDPEKYFSNLLEEATLSGTIDSFANRMVDAMIPGDPRSNGWLTLFSVDNFENFCKERAKLILSKVRDYVGDSLRDDKREQEEFIDEE